MATVVFGAHRSVGNKVCRAIRPPDTRPCQRHDLAWARAVYGIQVDRAPAAAVARAGAVYRLVSLVEREGPVALEVWIVDAAGKVLAGRKARFCYPMVRRGGRLACGPNVVRVTVEPKGHGDFTMTASGYQACGKPGPYGVRVEDGAIPSDAVLGLGMLALTNHRHLNLVFQRQPARGPVTPYARCPLVEARP